MSQHRPSKKARSAAAVTLGVAAALAVSGCVESRAEPGAGAIDVTWVDDVAPLLAERCASCHGATTPAGNYRLDAYCAPAAPSTEECAGVLGPGSDGEANVLLGENAGTSRLLTVFEGEGELAVQHRGYLAGDDGDGAYQDRLDLLEDWVIRNEAAYFVSSIHDARILDPRQDGFHGETIADDGWRMDSCRSCHGEDYRGGAVGVPCTTCHTRREGPEACDTCHGTGEAGTPPPGLDADDPAGPHQQHLAPAEQRFVEVTCDECHKIPTAYDDPDHIGVDPDGRAEIFFGPKANARGVVTNYEVADKSCTVACHGAGLGGSTAPAWALDTGFGCGSCHGSPPEQLANGADHALSPRCEECHPVQTGTGAPFPPPAPAAHGDGVISVLDRVNVANCEGCHTGSKAAVATQPFRDTAGDTDPADPQVGAHVAHLNGSFVSAGMDCNACHLVPGTVGDHPHVDADAGAELGFGDVAKGPEGRRLEPTFDPATRTCTNTWCHGAGLAGGQPTSPAWIVPTDLGCDSCHAMPPPTETHQAAPGLACGTSGCHSAVIDEGFSWTNQSLHVNGQVNTD